MRCALLLTLVQKNDNARQMKLRTVRSLKSILILMKKNSRVEEIKTASNDSAMNSENLSSGSPPRVVTSDELFSSGTEVGIIHQGAMYRLRITRGGKLILNK
jgi:hemin uptake protein HemP